MDSFYNVPLDNNENNGRNSNSSTLNISPASANAISDDQATTQPLPVDTRSQSSRRPSTDFPDSSRSSSNTTENRNCRRSNTHRSKSATVEVWNSAHPNSANPTTTSSSRNRRRRNQHADNHHSSSRAQRSSRQGDNSGRTDNNTSRRNHVPRSNTHHPRNISRQNSSSGTSRLSNLSRSTARVSRHPDQGKLAQEGHSHVTPTDHRRHRRHTHRHREISRNHTNVNDCTNAQHSRPPRHMDAESDESTETEHRVGDLRVAQTTTAGIETDTVLSDVHDQSTPGNDRAQHSGESSYDALYRRLSAHIGDTLIERAISALNDQLSDLILELVTSIHETMPVESMFDSQSQQGATEVELSQLRHLLWKNGQWTYRGRTMELAYVSFVQISTFQMQL